MNASKINSSIKPQLGSCDIGVKPATVECTPVNGGLEKVPDETVKEWQAYAGKLLKNSPRMKPDRLRRKVAEHFKIKLT